MANKEEILFSRQSQLFAEQVNSFDILSNSCVLILNNDLIGLEIARNLVLAGINKIKIARSKDETDEQLIEEEEFKRVALSSQRILSHITFLSEEESNLFLQPHSIENNNENDIEKQNKLIIEKQLEGISLIIVGKSQYLLKNFQNLNNISRKMKIPSIFTNTFGLLSFIFIDVGIEHSYLVTTERVKKVIAKIDKKRGIITVADKYHHFYPSSFVKFTSMSKSLKILEKNGPFQVTSFISNTQFAIQLPPSLLNDNNNEGEENEEDEIETGGICEEVEELFTISHKSLEENIKENLNCKSPLLHPLKKRTYLAIDALLQFHANYHRLPIRPNNNNNNDDNEDDFSKLLKLQPLFDNDKNNINNKNNMGALEKEYLRKVAYQSSAPVVPVMGNIIGGLIAQEVLKIILKSNLPISQWLFFDSISSLPPDYLSLPSDNFHPLPQERHGNQIKLFGRKLYEQVKRRKLFIVGAGALGCEFLKLFSLTGLSEEPEKNSSNDHQVDNNSGKIFICDPDTISASNLHRQYLFNEEDIGKSKSMIASERIIQSNNQMKIIAYSSELTLSSLLSVFTEKKIWDNLTEIISAVDTVKARELMNKISVAKNIPFLESGTKGNNCNTTQYIPSFSKRFEIPHFNQLEEINCLGKNFPFRPRHTIHWAKDLFDKFFYRTIYLFNLDNSLLYLNNDNEKNKRDQLGDGSNLLLRSLGGLRKSSREERINFCYKIFEILFYDKIKAIQEEHPLDSLDPQGEKFWVGYRIFPKTINIGEEKELEKEFIDSFLALFDIIFQTNPPSPISFDKDNEIHIKFLYGTGNMYSKSYGIPVLSKLGVQMIGGEITPAIITSSCICVGLVGLQLYRIIHLPPIFSPSSLVYEEDNLINNNNNNNDEKKNNNNNDNGDGGDKNKSNDNNNNNNNNNDKEERERKYKESLENANEILDNLRDYSVNSNGNHLLEFPCLQKKDFKIVHNNMLEIRSLPLSVTFSQIVHFIKRKLNINVKLIFSEQLNQAEEAIFPVFSGVEKSVYDVITSFKPTSFLENLSFYFEAEVESEEIEDQIDLLLHFSNFPN